MNGRMKVFEVIGWITLVFLSVLGVAGSVMHLLDSGIRVGDLPSVHATTLTLYGSDFTPHWYDFRDIPVTRVAHMMPGLLWMIFAPLQFVKRIRRGAPRFHRWVGRITISMILILIPSGIVFAALHPFADAFGEMVPISFYTLIYVASAVLGVRAARRRKFAIHREWMIRAFAVGAGISSVRVWFVIFLHTTGMHSQRFFATAFWLAFAVNLVIAEIWIHATRQRQTAERRELRAVPQAASEARAEAPWPASEVA